MLNSDECKISLTDWTRLSNLIHEDQTSFITGHVIFSLDAVKALDRPEWRYLWTMLRRSGLGSSFIHIIQTLYTNPTACVCTVISRKGCRTELSLFSNSVCIMISTLSLSSQRELFDLSDTHQEYYRPHFTKCQYSCPFSHQGFGTSSLSFI